MALWPYGPLALTPALSQGERETLLHVSEALLHGSEELLHVSEALFTRSIGSLSRLRERVRVRARQRLISGEGHTAPNLTITG
ncbi:hypothetical protein C1Y42_13440 [Pantoea sp. ICBG 985]|nr:hypothetical protein C1Y42_13440 [Pantoea sp. ICBG 985]